MSIKTDRPQVRTADELERKYNFAGIQQNVKMNNTGLVKVANELYNFVSAVAGDTATLEKQLDGQIGTYYGNGIPTNENEPAISWENPSEHIGDLYYDRETGLSYKYSDNLEWEQTESTLLSEILAIANAAQDTADNKRTTFITNNATDTPNPPYDTGDIWIKNVGQDNGEIYICQRGKEVGDTYQDGDFIVATKYIDDSVVLTSEQVAEIVTTETSEWVADTQSLTGYFTKEKKAQIDDSTSYVLDKVVKQVQIDGDITLSADNSVFSLKITNSGIEIRNVAKTDPISSWIEDGMDIKKLYLGNFAFIPRNNGSLGFRKVK